jgi:predicted Zn-dependent peptidase
MLFKGTEKRTCEDIVQTLSSLGVEYNAFTSTVATCYHTKGLSSNVDVCCDVLSDMFFNLKFSDEEFTREAEVIVQEILMHDDNPRSALSELASLTFFKGTGYGHSIAGTKQSVRSFKPSDIHKFIKKHYVAPKTLISFAGDISVEQAEKLVEKYFKFKTIGEPQQREIKDKTLTPKSQIVGRDREIEQHNVAVLFPACSIYSDDRYALTLFAEIFSSDMSSRLFSSVREKLGLVYSISGGATLTHEGGYYYIWFSCVPQNTAKVFEVIKQEIDRILKDGITKEELQKAKNIKQADRLFESESVESVNLRNVGMLAELNQVEPVEKYLEKINKLTIDDINKVLRKYLVADRAITAIVGAKAKRVNKVF